MGTKVASFKDSDAAVHLMDALHKTFSFADCEIDSSSSISNGFIVKVFCITKQEQRQVESFMKGYMAAFKLFQEERVVYG